jgi:hypothetical protein
LLSVSDDFSYSLENKHSHLFNWTELELTVSHTQGENGNHYTTEIWLSGRVREIYPAVVVFVYKKKI